MEETNLKSTLTNIKFGYKWACAKIRIINAILQDNLDGEYHLDLHKIKCDIWKLFKGNKEYIKMKHIFGWAVY